MAFWRMQLHPTDPGRAAMHTVESLGASQIGIGFRSDPGDLTRLDPADPRPEGVTAQDHAFGTKMAEGDKVLVIVHNYPFALATVDGGYNYVRRVVPELGIWFNHFRRVRDVRYYADRVLNPREWQELAFAATIQILSDPALPTYQLIESWSQEA